MNPHLVMLKGKKKRTLLTPVFWCCCRALWKRAWGTSGIRWLLLVYTDMGFKFCILVVWDICLSCVPELSGDIPVGICAPPWCGRVHLFPLWILTDSQLSSLLRLPSAGSDVVSDFLWPCKSQKAPGQTRTHLPKESCSRSDIPLHLTELIHPTSFLFFLPSCPFLFGLTLVTDDKAAFPAKPINKLNREKMSI